MITNTIAAWQVEEDDVITLGGDDTFQVVTVDGDKDVNITLMNDEGDVETFCFLAGDDIQIVVSWDDPEE